MENKWLVVSSFIKQCSSYVVLSISFLRDILTCLCEILILNNFFVFQMAKEPSKILIIFMLFFCGLLSHFLPFHKYCCTFYCCCTFFAYGLYIFLCGPQAVWHGLYGILNSCLLASCDSTFLNIFDLLWILLYITTKCMTL